MEDSIGDHSADLLGAKNGSKKRYDGLKGEKDYKKAAQIIKDGGYATSSTYVEKLCSIIVKYNLTQCDGATSTPSNSDTVTAFPAVPFMVRVLIDDLNYRSKESMDGKANGQTGKGTFTIVSVKDGWGKLKSGAGWIWLGNPDYCTVLGAAYGEQKAFRPYTVKVDIDDLNIRTGPGTEHPTIGKYTGKGIFTIVEEKNGWGKLKSGVGWISLAYTTRC